MYHHTKDEANRWVIRLGNNEVLKTLKKTLTFVDANADAVVVQQLSVNVVQAS